MAALLLVSVALLASVMPAWHAARINPLEAVSAWNEQVLRRERAQRRPTPNRAPTTAARGIPGYPNALS